MMKGHLDKMKTSIVDGIVHYQLPIDNELITMNDLIGQKIQIVFERAIHCMNCGKQTKTSFGQGYCYQCFNTIPETEECTLRPEKCKAHLGIARDMDWAKSHCLIDHIVYLSFTGNIKVGVTRVSQVPTRWIDQGAIRAIKLCKTPNRHIAGLIEVYLKNHLSDKTSWQKMLKLVDVQFPDLQQEKHRVIEFLPDGLRKFVHEDDKVQNIQYPMNKIPLSIISTNFNKNTQIEGILTGIKGQYLIFNNSRVINIRSHRGYLVSLIS